MDRGYFLNQGKEYLERNNNTKIDVERNNPEIFKNNSKYSSLDDSDSDSEKIKRKKKFVTLKDLIRSGKKGNFKDLTSHIVTLIGEVFQEGFTSNLSGDNLDNLNNNDLYPQVNNVIDKELEELKQLEDKFQQVLSQYSTKYMTYMTNIKNRVSTKTTQYDGKIEVSTLNASNTSNTYDEENSELKQELEDLNQELISIAEEVYHKIELAKSKVKQLGIYENKSDEVINKNMAEFNRLYDKFSHYYGRSSGQLSNINPSIGEKNSVVYQAMVEDNKLRNISASYTYYMWLIITLFFLYVLYKVFEKGFGNTTSSGNSFATPKFMTPRASQGQLFRTPTPAPAQIFDFTSPQNAISSIVNTVRSTPEKILTPLQNVGNTLRETVQNIGERVSQGFT
jgi:hypothetical protein